MKQNEGNDCKLKKLPIVRQTLPTILQEMYSEEFGEYAY